MYAGERTALKTTKTGVITTYAYTIAKTLFSADQPVIPVSLYLFDRIMEDTILNWSSGKDAAMAFYYLKQSDSYRVRGLLTSVSASYKRVSMHGVREEIVDLQAQRMDLPLQKIYLPEQADMPVYNEIMGTAVARIKAEGVGTMAFGDIFLEDLRRYREEQLARGGMKAVFPLWKKNTKDLVHAIEDAEIKAMIVCVNTAYLGENFLGRLVNRSLVQDLPANVDPCGENGEFHTLVIDAPFFARPLPVVKGETVYREYPLNATEKAGFYFLDINMA